MDEKERERRRQENLEVLAGMRLLDDDFMTAVFQDALDCVDLTIGIILGKPDFKATKAITQDTLANLQKRSVRLDIHAFAEGEEYDVEVQRARKGASPKRARLNASLMDANSLYAGEEYEKLPRSVVIFLTEEDVLGLELPIYFIERRVRGTDKVFEDGTLIVYVNCAHEDDSTDLGRLVHDFKCTKASEMYYKALAKRVRYFKEEPKGVEKMCEAIERLAEKRADRLLEKRAQRAAEQTTAKYIGNMLKKDQSVETIADLLGLPLENVRRIAKEAGFAY